MLGTFSIVVLLFCAMVLFIAYLFEQAGLTTEMFTGATAADLDTLTNNNQVQIEQNSAYPFGNFGAALAAVGSLIINGATGGIVTDVLAQLPFYNVGIMLFVRFLYTFSAFWLALQIATGRGF